MIMGVTQVVPDLEEEEDCLTDRGGEIPHIHKLFLLPYLPKFKMRI
jgi:hypothetical protein